MHFKDYLIEKINNTDNEADIVLHQVINNVDEAHVDYTDDRLDFNVGIMVKRSNYTRLFITIMRESDEQVRLAKNAQADKDGYTIVIETDDYPTRMDIDQFLSSKPVNSIISKCSMLLGSPLLWSWSISIGSQLKIIIVTATISLYCLSQARNLYVFTLTPFLPNLRRHCRGFFCKAE